MDERLTDAVFRLTVVLVTAGFCLVGAGLAGVSGSLALVVGLFGAGAAFYGLAPAAEDTVVDRLDSAAVVPVLWGGPVVAGVVALVFLGASPGEVQALGGILGLLGMTNYFLRPVYHLLYGLASRVANA